MFIFKLSFITCLIVLIILPVSSIAQKKWYSYEDLVSELDDLTISDSISVNIKNFEIRKDVGKFELQEGTFYFCNPINHYLRCAIFNGSGKFSFTPPTQIEQDQLYRFYQTTTFDTSFNFLFIIFDDNTADEIIHSGIISRKKVPEELLPQLDYALEFIEDSDNQYIYDPIARSILEDGMSRYFYAHFSSEKLEPFFFEKNPYRVEEIRFMRRQMISTIFKRWDVICQFHQQADYYLKKNLITEHKDDLIINHYTIDCDIDEDGLLTVFAKLDIFPLNGNYHWFNLTIHPDVELDTLYIKGYEKLYYFKGEDNPVIWVYLPEPFSTLEKKELFLKYRGEIISKEWDAYYMEESIYWYPSYNRSHRSQFDLTFHFPADLKLVSVGDLKCEQIANGCVNSEWSGNTPMRNLSFSLGEFKTFRYDSTDDIPEIQMILTRIGLERMRKTWGFDDDTRYENIILKDIVECVKFYTNIFGKPIVKCITITESRRLWHSEAFPGLIHLETNQFNLMGKYQFDRFVRAHEIAHQWWPVGVDYLSYHDQWMSEGFATYFGLMFLPHISKKYADFLYILENFRKNIIEIRQFLIEEGQEIGPVCLGWRTHTSTTPFDHQLMVYEKGAWILHMIRMMMIDINDFSDTRFFAMMKDFYSSFVGKSATTDDFCTILSKHMGSDMTWFFDQWIYSTELPSFKVYFKINKGENDLYSVKADILTSNVPIDYTYHVLIHVDYGSNMYSLFRVNLSGNRTKFEFPPLRYEPKNITFNYLESVLCKSVEQQIK